MRFNGSVIEFNIDNEVGPEIFLTSQNSNLIHAIPIVLNNKYSIELDDIMVDSSPLPEGKYELSIKSEDGKYTPLLADSLIKYDSIMYWFNMGKRFDFQLHIKQNVDDSMLMITVQAMGNVSTTKVDRQLNQKKENRRITQLKKVLFRVLYKLFIFFPVNRRKVAFLSDSRTEMTGNFEYLQNEINSRNNIFKIKKILQKSNQQKRSAIKYIYTAWLIATSRFVVLDDFYPLIYPLKIRKSVDLIQVWHAVGAFKTFGFSRVGKPGGPKPTSKNHRNYTHAIVSSKFVAPFYAEGFGIDINRVDNLGVARTDMFFRDNLKDKLIEETKQELPFLDGKRVILFAPTFRGNGQTTAHYKFDKINFNDIFNKLNDGKTVFLLKIHPFVLNKPDIPSEYSEFFYDISYYREINNLLLLADILVTDYSSVVFEYALLKKKMIFFAPDLEEYIATRDFYVDYKSFVPGPIAYSTDELIEHLLDNSFDMQELEGFLNKYFDFLDGNSSKRIVDAMENGFTQ